jgi:hypothetical protein
MPRHGRLLTLTLLTEATFGPGAALTAVGLALAPAWVEASRAAERR